MIVELNRLVAFGDEWFSHDPRRLEDMVFEAMTINTEFVAWAKRWNGPTGFDFCDVHMADRGGNYTLDITYEAMRDLMKSGGASRAA